MSDLIDRQKVINAMAELQGRAETKAELKGISKAWKRITKLPSAEPERKKGRWIKEDLTGYLTPGGNGIWHCSECGHQEGPYPSAKLTDFCPDCGADMRKEQ